MKKAVISFMGYNADFLKSKHGALGAINEEGPNMLLHKYYIPQIKADYHYLLYDQEEASTVKKVNYLYRELRQVAQNNHCILQTECIGIEDPIDINSIYLKLHAFLMEMTDYEVHILFSTGTHTIHAAWALCASSFKQLNNIQLIQFRPSKHTTSGDPEFMNVTLPPSYVGTTLMAKEKVLKKEGSQSENWWDHHWGASLEGSYDLAVAAASFNVTTLINGENGTGKEGIARFIHEEGKRKGVVHGEYIAVNCSAFTDELLRSELFGHKKGAFTGAEKDKIGLIESAEHGTLFLDEFGDISPYMQQSMLRVLQEKEYFAVGSTEVKKVKAKIVLATNKNLNKEVADGNFREDLYYRITQLEIELPALRNRLADERKTLLSQLKKKAQKHLGIDQELLLNKELYEFLIYRYNFPGNIREMEQIIMNLYMKSKLGKREAVLSDLPSRIKATTVEDKNIIKLHPFTGVRKWKEIEKIHLQEMLKLKLSQKKLAEEVGYNSVNTLKKKLSNYGLD